MTTRRACDSPVSSCRVWLQLASACSRRSVVAETAYGRVRGTDVSGIKVFKGIPYGASTAGKNRFMPPAAPAKWTRRARRARVWVECAADASRARRGAAVRTRGGGSRPAAESEDCLVLNVWTPAVSDGRKRPVMFWCHGGGFATGSGSSPVTEGANLAKRGDVVVVTINHRLNVLGFTSLEEAGGPEFARVRRCRHARHRARAALGARQHRPVRRRSGHRHGLRPVRRRPEGGAHCWRCRLRRGCSIAPRSRAARRCKLVERESGARVARELMSDARVSKKRRSATCRPCRSTGSWRRTSKVVRKHERRPDDDGVFSPLVDGRSCRSIRSIRRRRRSRPTCR